MALSRRRMLDRMEARDASYDGRFITGVLSTGIYCLPSCPARNPKPENVRFFRDPETAREAGLRACKRCRPDDFYRRSDPDRERVEALVRRIDAAPGAWATAESLVGDSDLGSSKLHALFRRHFHTTPARRLQRARLRTAEEALIGSDRSVSQVAWDAGYETLSVFHENFRRRAGMSPGDFRRLRGAGGFEIELPKGYPRETILAQLGRNPLSLSEKVEGSAYRAATWLGGQPGVVEAHLDDGRLRATVRGGGRSARRALRAHRFLLRRLGLRGDPASFERRVAARPDLRGLIAGRRGLRMVRTADAFEGLTWAILGQQINLPFAFALDRRLVELAGRPATGGLWVHPRAGEVAEVSEEALLERQFSRRKAEYLIGVARCIAAGELDLEGLAEGAATRAEESLLALRGLGPWTANYVMMRGLGFEDCVPVGDAGLVRGLQTFFGLPERPSAEETQELMRPFAPFRTYATAHLWQSLEDAA